MGDGFTKEKSFSWQKKSCFFCLEQIFLSLCRIWTPTPSFQKNVASFCFQKNFEEFPHSDTDSVEIHCLIRVMGKWPQIRASLQWNNRNKLYFFSLFFYVCNKMVVVAILFANSSGAFLQDFVRRHCFTLISQSSSVRKSAATTTFIRN